MRTEKAIWQWKAAAAMYSASAVFNLTHGYYYWGALCTLGALEAAIAAGVLFALRERRQW